MDVPLLDQVKILSAVCIPIVAVIAIVLEHLERWGQLRHMHVCHLADGRKEKPEIALFGIPSELRRVTEANVYEALGFRLFQLFEKLFC